jgi:hypothetical protein
MQPLAAPAYGLTTEASAAEGHFAGAAASLAGGTWPFERAQLQLDYGERLTARGGPVGGTCASFQPLMVSPGQRSVAETRIGQACLW